MSRDMEMAMKLAERVSAAGGRAYFVGGYVRDLLLHKDNKDIDIEVHGLMPEKLCEILNSLGEMTVMGASFGIYGLKHYSLDIALPRREKAFGYGHRDFEVYVDPFQGTKQAACRRDFTVNAMMQDVLTGEVIDHFGGAEDLKRGIIRHVNDDTFVEDPLRVFRAAQFAARFGFSVAEETKSISSVMRLWELAPERVLDELKKALLKSDTPSVFFRVLKDVGQLEPWFSELAALCGAEKGEGSASLWERAMLLLDNTAKLRTKAKEPFCLMLAALCCAASQGKAGPDGAGKMLERLTNDKKLLRYSHNMLMLDQRLKELCLESASVTRFCRLYDSSVCPEDLILMAEADNSTDRVSRISDEELRGISDSMLKEYIDIMSRPYVKGADLVAAGYKPGIYFNAALKYAHELRLSGVCREAALQQTVDFIGSIINVGVEQSQ